MNLHGQLYFAYIRGRGSRVPEHYRAYLAADARGAGPEVSRDLLARLLLHCRAQVPYYAALLPDAATIERDPHAALARLPILTKRTIRDRFEDLKSRDLPARQWSLNTSGGSTGEPARFVQDREYNERTNALALAHAHWAGHDVGEPAIKLWGSEPDVVRGTLGWTKKAANALTRTTFVNAFRLTPETKREFARALLRIRPRLVLAYAQALYEVAGFLERERLEIPPVETVITSAGTLHDFMRQRIERAFRCRVFDRYGSREVGLIAGERPGVEGLWVPPWSTLLEIVDEQGRPAPPGTDGEILVTSMVNHAMPLVRYRIGDRGALAAGRVRGGQVLLRLLGRNVDAFRRRDGTAVDGSFFTRQLYFRDWVQKFQFVQTDYDEVLLRVVSGTRERARLGRELDEIAAKVRIALGDTAVLRVEWVDEIPPAPSGKFRYTISEVPAP